MEEAPAWARALQRHLDDQINALGEYVEGEMGRLDAVQTQVNLLAGVAQEVTPKVEILRGPGVVIREPPPPPPRTPAVDEAE